jgi:hypothetical protein
MWSVTMGKNVVAEASEATSFAMGQKVPGSKCQRQIVELSA